MDSLARALDQKLHQWRPPVSNEVRLRVLEIMDRADDDSLDVARSRATEQEVLGILDAPR